MDILIKLSPNIQEIDSCDINLSSFVTDDIHHFLVDWDGKLHEIVVTHPVTHEAVHNGIVTECGKKFESMASIIEAQPGKWKSLLFRKSQ